MKKIMYGSMFVVVILLILLINIGKSISYKNDKDKPTTTTKVVTELTKDTKFDTITIEGMEEEILVKKYSSHFGFNFYYQEDLFSPSLLSNGSIQIINITDESMYLLIERLPEEEYYTQYELLNGREELNDEYISMYSFYRLNNNFLKITKCIKNDVELMEGINIRMNYIINSLDNN